MLLKFITIVRNTDSSILSARPSPGTAIEKKNYYTI